jgi:hypothetical protein
LWGWPIPAMLLWRSLTHTKNGNDALCPFRTSAKNFSHRPSESLSAERLPSSSFPFSSTSVEVLTSSGFRYGGLLRVIRSLMGFLPFPAPSSDCVCLSYQLRAFRAQMDRSCGMAATYFQTVLLIVYAFPKTTPRRHLLNAEKAICLGGDISTSCTFGSEMTNACTEAAYHAGAPRLCPNQHQMLCFTMPPESHVFRKPCGRSGCD